MAAWTDVVRVFGVQNLERTPFSSLMTSICLKRKSMVPSRPLSFSGNGWTMKAGMSSTVRRNSAKLWVSLSVLLCNHLVAKKPSQIGTSVTTMSFTSSPTRILHSRLFSEASWNGTSWLRPSTLTVQVSRVRRTKSWKPRLKLIKKSRKDSVRHLPSLTTHTT